MKLFAFALTFVAALGGVALMVPREPQPITASFPMSPGVVVTN